ncbi:MAG: hypothetical protein Q7J54_05365 [Candidatus Woesearchaeota archaeon]|nr:hypothetical protein [Candidatus Woesearchaeota archaeon]
MERRISDRNILDKFCLNFCKVLEKHCKYIVVSGFVAISSGRPRGTEDIDIILEKLIKEQFILLHNDLVKKGFVCMQGLDASKLYDDYMNENISIRYTWKNEPLPEAEIKFSKDALDEYQLKTKVKLKLTGLDVWFGSINMNIAFKEEYLKSEKDMGDAKHLRIVYAELVDEKEINKIKELIRRLRL